MLESKCNTAATKKKKKRRQLAQLSSPHSSEFSDQMRLDDLDRRNGSLSQAARPSNSGEKEWERRRARVERKKQSKNEKETVKNLGIWGFLFVLIIDCFVVNFLDWICSLSCWILVCLEDNDVIFGTIDLDHLFFFLVLQMFNRF